MADKFNVDPGVKPAPNLLPGGGGIGGHPGNVGQGIASLFEGVGGFLSGLQQSQRQRDINALNTVVNRDNIMPDTVDRLPPANTDASTTPTKSTTSGGTATPEVPNEVASTVKTNESQYLSYKQGKLSEANFWNMVSTQQRDLMNKYPQYSKEIRDMYLRNYGHDPQKKASDTFFEAQKKQEAEMKDEEKRWRDVKSEAAGLGIAPNEILAGDNNTEVRRKIEAKVLSQKAINAQSEAQKKNLELKKAQGADVENDFFRTAQTDIKQTTDALFANTMDAVEANGVSLAQINKRKAEAMADGVMSPQETQELRVLWDQFKLVANTRINGAIRYYSDKVSPEKFASLKKYAEDELKFYEDHILSGNTGILEWNKKTLESARSGDAYSVMTQSPTMRNIGAAKVIGGDAAANTILTQNLGQLKEESSRIRLFPLVSDMTKGVPLANGLTKHTEGASPASRAELATTSITGGVKVITDPKATPQVVSNVIESLFGKDNARLVEEFHPNSRTKIFSMMASPAMVVKMQQLKESDPASYEKFKGWATNSFHILMNGHVENLKNNFSGDFNSTNQSKQPYLVGFNGKNFTVSLNPSIAEGSRKNYINANPNVSGAQRTIVESVRELNRAIDIMRPIAEDGDEKGIDKLLSPFFSGTGLGKTARTDMDYVAKAYNDFKLSEENIDAVSPRGSNLAKPVGKVDENPRTTPKTTEGTNLADHNLPTISGSVTDLPPSIPTSLETTTPTTGDPNATPEGGYWVQRLQPDGTYKEVLIRNDATVVTNPDGTPVSRGQQTAATETPKSSERPKPVLGARDPSEWGKPTSKEELDKAVPKASESTKSEVVRRASNPLGLQVQTEAQANDNPMVAGYIMPTDGSYTPQDVVRSIGTSASGGLEPKGLLGLIGKHEAGSKGYNAVYSGSGKSANLTGMSISQVLNFQDSIKSSGSTAVGKYQFLQKTLRGLVKEMGLNPNTQFTPQLQDDLARALLKKRGLDKYLSGKMSEEEFADNLSKEWAALPYNTGKSFYAGDSVGNKSSVSRKQLISMIRNLKTEEDLPKSIKTSNENSSLAKDLLSGKAVDMKEYRKEENQKDLKDPFFTRPVKENSWPNKDKDGYPIYKNPEEAVSNLEERLVNNAHTNPTFFNDPAMRPVLNRAKKDILSILKRAENDPELQRDLARLQGEKTYRKNYGSSAWALWYTWMYQNRGDIGENVDINENTLGALTFFGDMKGRPSFNFRKWTR